MKFVNKWYNEMGVPPYPFCVLLTYRSFVVSPISFVPDGACVTINGVKIIPIALIEKYHKDDFKTFLVWLRGQRVMAIGDTFGVYLNTYHKWVDLFYKIPEDVNYKTKPSQ